MYPQLKKGPVVTSFICCAYFSYLATLDRAEREMAYTLVIQQMNASRDVREEGCMHLLLYGTHAAYRMDLCEHVFEHKSCLTID
jgi:hypothetical protein